MIKVKVNYENGDSTVTRINATPAEARAYITSGRRSTSEAQRTICSAARGLKSCPVERPAGHAWPASSPIDTGHKKNYNIDSRDTRRKRGFIMNTKITFVHAKHFDLGANDCGFDQQRDFIVVGDGYTFDDYLHDAEIRFVQDSDPDTYFVLDDDLSAETRTGEAYRIISETPTDESLKA